MSTSRSTCEGPAEADVGGLRLVEVEGGEAGPCGLGDGHHRELLTELVEGAGGVEPELPHSRTTERGQVPADAQPRAQVTGDGADVGAAGAAQVEVDVQHGGAVDLAGRDPVDGQRVDGDRRGP